MKKILLLVLCFTINLFAARKTKIILQEIDNVQDITELTQLSSILKEVANSKEDKQYTIKAAVFLKLMKIKPPLFSYHRYIEMLKYHNIPQSLIINVSKTAIKKAVDLALQSPEKYDLTVQELQRLVKQVGFEYVEPEIKALFNNKDATRLLLYRSLGAIAKKGKDSLIMQQTAKEVLLEYWKLVKQCIPDEQFKDFETVVEKALKPIREVLDEGKVSLKKQFEHEQFEHDETGKVEHPEYEKLTIQQQAFEVAFKDLQSCTLEDASSECALLETQYKIFSKTEPESFTLHAAEGKDQLVSKPRRYELSSLSRTVDNELDSNHEKDKEKKKGNKEERHNKPLPPIPQQPQARTLRTSHDSGIADQEPLELQEAEEEARIRDLGQLHTRQGFNSDER